MKNHSQHIAKNLHTCQKPNTRWKTILKHMAKNQFQTCGEKPYSNMSKNRFQTHNEKPFPNTWRKTISKHAVKNHAYTHAKKPNTRRKTILKHMAKNHGEKPYSNT